MRTLFILMSIVFFMTACQNQKSKSSKADSHEVVVQEVLQAGAEYTYLRVKEDDKELWLAVPAMQAKAGDTYYYKGGLPMKDFKSSELNRTFTSVLFLEGISTQPITNDAPTMKADKDASMAAGAPHSMTPVKKENIKIEPAEGRITIAKLYSGKGTYAGKSVKVKGQVTKFSPGIMNKNWVHIQDGTDFEGKFDLTVTVSSALEVEVNDIVTLEGKISVDKDFGMGYTYDVIMEDAVLK
jgi:hypothetical protein